MNTFTGTSLTAKVPILFENLSKKIQQTLSFRLRDRNTGTFVNLGEGL